MQTVQFQGVSTGIRVTTDQWHAMGGAGFPGAWVKLASVGELDADTAAGPSNMATVSIMKPHWYEHPYFIGGVVGLLLGVASGIAVGRITKKRR